MEKPTTPTDPKTVAARALARTCSPRAAARRSGLSLAEVRALQTDPEFGALVIEFRTTKVFRTLVAILDAGPAAVKVLTDELDRVPTTKRIGRPPKDEKFLVTKPKVDEGDPRKIRAAKEILEHFRWAMESADLLSRIRVLEERLARQGVAIPALPPIPDESP